MAHALLDGPLDDTLASALESAASEARGRALAVARLPRSGPLLPGELAFWLGRAFGSSATGRLWLTSGGTEVSLFLQAGRVVLATGGDPGLRLGELLVRQGRLGDADRDQLLAEAQASGRRLGAILVQQGRLASAELLALLRLQQEEVVALALGLSSGVIGFDPELRADPGRARLLRHPARLVREGLSGKAAARAALWQRLGGPTAVLRLVDPGPASDVLFAAASDQEQARLAAFDGQRSCASVARSCGMSEDELLPLAVTLLAFGALAPAGLAGVDARSERELCGERLVLRLGLVRSGDYFELLGLERDAGPVQVARALERAERELALVAADPELMATLAPEREAVREALAEAARVLGDPELRARYRAALG